MPAGGIGPGGTKTVRVVAELIQPTTLGHTTLATPDENGGGTAGTVTPGIDAGDGSFARFDILNYNLPGQAGRSDFNCNGVVDATDGAILREFILYDAASGPGSGVTYCP